MKIGLALGGGGVKSVAHVGVLRVIEAHKIPIDVVTGTSAGAIVGALYAAGKSADEIEELARRMSFRSWFARDTTKMGLFSTKGIRRIVENAVGRGCRIQDLPRKFACVAVDLESEQEVVFDSGPLADAVCASAAYPGLYAPVRLGDRYLFDGGVLNPVPFDVARGCGADYVIASDLGARESFFGDPSSRRLRHGGILWRLFYSWSHQQMFRVIDRSIGIMSQQIRDIKMSQSPPDLLLCPKVNEVGLLDFDLVETCFSAGQVVAQEHLPELRALLNPDHKENRTQNGREFWAWARRALARGRQTIFDRFSTEL